MGVIGNMMGFLFGSGGGVLKETAEVFRENAEAAGARDAALAQAALGQFGAEFAQAKPGVFDRVVDGLNRLPRPALAIGTLGLFVSAMVDPVWFASRMQGVALVPEPLWWLMGAIVSFYFGARHQAKGQAFQRSIADSVARTQIVTENLRALRALDAGFEGAAVSYDEASDAGAAVQPMVAQPAAGDNPALIEWRAQHVR